MTSVSQNEPKQSKLFFRHLRVPAKEVYGSPVMAHVFANVSNHDLISIMVVTQNAFPKVRSNKASTAKGQSGFIWPILF